MFIYIDVHVYYPKEHYPELWQIPPETLYSEDLCFTYTFRGSYTIFDWDQYRFGSADLYLLTCNLIFKYFAI
jgi:hypothetical protein